MAKRKKSLKLEAKEEEKLEEMSDTEALKKEGMLTEGTYEDHLPKEEESKLEEKEEPLPEPTPKGLKCTLTKDCPGDLLLLKTVKKTALTEEYYKCSKCDKGLTKMMQEATRKSTK